MDMFPLLSIQDGFTPLLMASQEGHTTVVKLLLEAKAKPDLQNKVMFAIIAFLICSVVVHLQCISALISSIGAVGPSWVESCHTVQDTA